MTDDRPTDRPDADVIARLTELLERIERIERTPADDDPSNPHVRRRNIVDLLDRGELSRAEAEIRELLDVQWKAPENTYLFGIVALMQGRFATARAAIDRALGVKPWLTEIPSSCGTLRESIRAARLDDPEWKFPIYRERLDAFDSYGLTLRSALSTHFERADVQLVQVGANDGVHTDPMHGWISKFGWTALLVEPMPAPFAALEAEHLERPNVTVANVAVSQSDGTRTMWSHPEGRHGVSTFLPDRNILRHQRDLVAVEVQCQTFESLLEQHSIRHIDVLQIDTEGFDFEVLKLVDLATVHPTLIHLEFYLLPIGERLELLALLDEHGYAWRALGPDLLAVDIPTFAEQFGLIRAIEE